MKNIINDIDEQPEEEVHRVKSRKVQSAVDFVPEELGYTTLPECLLTQKLIKFPSSWTFIELKLQDPNLPGGWWMGVRFPTLLSLCPSSDLASLTS